MTACSTLFYLCCQAWCGSATIYLTVGVRGYLYLFPSLTTVFFLAQLFRPTPVGSALVLSLLHWCPKALKLFFVIPHQSLREKGAKLD